MPTSLSIYRSEPSVPVCATCIHRADAKHQDQSEPWRDWFCLLSKHELWAEEYNPITGVTTPARVGWKRCREVNGDGDCGSWELSPAVTSPAKGHAEREPDHDAEREPVTGWRARLIKWLGGQP